MSIGKTTVALLKTSSLCELRKSIAPTGQAISSVDHRGHDLVEPNSVRYDVELRRCVTGFGHRRHRLGNRRFSHRGKIEASHATIRICKGRRARLVTKIILVPITRSPCATIQRCCLTIDPRPSRKPDGWSSSAGLCVKRIAY